MRSARTIRLKDRRRRDKWPAKRGQPRAPRNLTSYLFGQYHRDAEGLKEALKELERRKKEPPAPDEGSASPQAKWIENQLRHCNQAGIQVVLFEFLERCETSIVLLQQYIEEDWHKGEGRRDKALNMCSRMIDMFCQFSGAMAVTKASGVLARPAGDQPTLRGPDLDNSSTANGGPTASHHD